MKKNMVYKNANETLPSHKKVLNVATWNNMDEPRGAHAKWNKPT